MSLQPEIDRYLRYLQERFLDSGPPQVETAEILKQSIHAKFNLVSQIAVGLFGEEQSRAFVEQYLADVDKYSPESELESFHSTAIFVPVLRHVQEACERLGIGPTRNVTLVNSPAISITPAARSSPLVDHVLLAGSGTFSFCNYWGKAISKIIVTLGRQIAPTPLYEADIEALFFGNPSLVELPVRLAAYFGFHDTLLGFGVIPSSKDDASYRMELVHAMEVFLFGHEFGHFVINESKDRDGVHALNSFGEELLADLIGFVICREFGSLGSWHAFSGSAPLIFFHSVQICEQAKFVITGRVSESNTHPDTSVRLERIRSLVAETTHSDNRDAAIAHLRECDHVCVALSKVVTAILRDVATENESSGSRGGPD